MTNRITYKVWDIAGVDSIQVVESLFGEAASYLAPFQSLETQIQGEACSVLRLCDRNFRICCSGALDQLANPLIQSLNARVWIKQYDWLNVITLPISQLPAIVECTTVKAPHRLTNLPENQAVPARLDDVAVLIWRHVVKTKPAIELHVAQADWHKLNEKMNLSFTV